MSECAVCKTDVKEILNLGMQPVCNRFITSLSEEEYFHPLIFNQCKACGLIQINDPVPVGELIPRYDWITYNEPESHLDGLAEMISSLPGIKKDAYVCGLSYKDDSTLRRLKGLGFKNVNRIDPTNDLGIKAQRAEIESLQDRMTPEAATAIGRKYGLADVILVRHILEHTHDTSRFITALKKLIKPDGYVVFEVPDCTQSIENLDYSMPWEEHVIYFTPETFRNSFAFMGFSLVHYKCYPYPFENSLVGIAQLNEKTLSSPSGAILEDEMRRARAYSKGLSGSRDKYKNYFSDYRKQRGKIALFGAGHLACTFINLLGLEDYIEFVVDDNPKKQGLFMPGSHLPIRGSSELINEDIKLCLLSVSPESEEKVIRNNRGFTDRGGIFASIFPVSNNALKLGID